MKKYALGIDVGGTNLKGALLNRKGEMSFLTRRSTNAKKNENAVLENIFILIDDVLKKANLEDSDLIGIGLGSPGYVSDGIISQAMNVPGWDGTEILKELENRYSTKAVGSNDVTVAALAEAMFGIAVNVNNMAMLAIGTGIGGGIVINKKIYNGRHDMAAEMGHMIVQKGGRKCGCNQNGCVEAYSSTLGIIQTAKELLDGPNGKDSLLYKSIDGNYNNIMPKNVYDCAKEGDALSLKINEITADYLAVAVGTVINLLAPDMIVLGGGVMNAGDILMNKVKDNLEQYTLPGPYKKCTVEYTKLGQDAGVIGAASLAISNLG